VDQRGPELTLLAADIGGTSARLALFDATGRRLLRSETYATHAWSSAEEVVREFLSSYRVRPAAACIAIAGPVEDGRSEPVNISWIVDARRLAAALGLLSVALVNDLEANARGILLLDASRLHVVSRGERSVHGNRVVVSAGTGLGEAGLVHHGGGYLVVGGEGGHADFAPRTELEVELYRFLAAEYGHVSYERVCSGAGLANIYRFLSGGDAPTPAAISAEAAADPGSRGAEALDLFASIYGARAANVALSFMATGGVYLGGGIAPRNLSVLTNGAFMRAFVAKGRVSGLLERIPVSIVVDDRTALLGAAAIAAEAAGALPLAA